MLDLNGVRLRNRVVTSASLLGYGAEAASGFFPYGMSPVGQFLPLERFGAVTTRTLTSSRGRATSRPGRLALRELPGASTPLLGALRRSTPAG